MTPRTFTPCAAFAREALSTPLVPWPCEKRPPTKAAQKAASTKWGATHGWARSHGVWLGHLRVHVQMQRVAQAEADGITTRPTFTVGLAKLATSHDLGIPMVEVEASPVDTLPARLHAAACCLLATYATRLDAQAAALTEEAAAVRALLPTPEPAPKARPTCPLCGTDADAPTVERLIFVPATVHAACSAVSDQTPEPGDAADRLPEFIEAHIPDAPDGSLRYREALARLSDCYPGILNIQAALKAAQPTK